MDEPATTIDRRYSDPAAVATSWAATRQVLETAELFWVTTVRADGRPHVTPVVAVWVDGAMYFSTGADEQKFRNLQANQNVVLTTGCNGWESGLDVVLEGQAVLVSDDGVLKGVATAFTGKWAGDWQWEVRDGSFWHPHGNGRAYVFAVRPAKAFAHAKGDPFGATTHRF